MDFDYVLSILNEFEISSSITAAHGKTFLATHQRFYMGALRENFTGSALSQSYAKMTSGRYWLDYLSDNTLKQHALSPLNYGAGAPSENTYFYEYGSNNFADDSTHGTAWVNTYAITGTLVPETRTLALNWDFSTLTSSSFAINDQLIEILK